MRNVVFQETLTLILWIENCVELKETEKCFDRFHSLHFVWQLNLKLFNFIKNGVHFNGLMNLI